MHELALCEEILAIIEGEAKRRNITRVRAVRLEIGVFACASAEALRFCFDAVNRRTVAEGATLEVLQKAGEASCLDCGGRVAVLDRDDPCPVCGGVVLVAGGGDQLRITELEVE